MGKATNLRLRATILSRIRAFLDARGFLAVDTPPLSATPIPESHIELFATRYRAPAWHHPDRPTERRLYLLPSPERHLKRLLAEGLGSLYEIAWSFRNGESIGPYHRPAFTMLEYYTLDADGADSLRLTRDLLTALEVPGEPLVWPMAEAWRRIAAIDLAATLADAADPAVPGSAGADRLAAELVARGVLADAAASEGWEQLFQRGFLTAVEPQLPRDRPVFLTDYPAAVPTLARRVPGTPWADRWELYLGGMEVANCFGEETDPARIASFQRVEAARRPPAENGEAIAWDDSFLQPPLPLPRCSGVALGVDRLVMHLAGATEIGEVIPIPDIV